MANSNIKKRNTKKTREPIAGTVCGRALRGKHRQGFCTNPQAHGTAIEGGPCYLHLGKPPQQEALLIKAKPRGGPTGNQHAYKHGAYAKTIPEHAIEVVKGMGVFDLEHHAQVINCQLYVLAEHQTQIIKEAQAALISEQEKVKPDLERVVSCQIALDQAITKPIEKAERLIKAGTTIAKTKLTIFKCLRENPILSRHEQQEVIIDVVNEANDDPSMSAQDMCREIAYRGATPPRWLLKEQLAELTIYHAPPPPQAPPIDAITQETAYQNLLENVEAERIKMKVRATRMIKTDKGIRR